MKTNELKRTLVSAESYIVDFMHLRHEVHRSDISRINFNSDEIAVETYKGEVRYAITYVELDLYFGLKKNLEAKYVGEITRLEKINKELTYVITVGEMQNKYLTETQNPYFADWKIKLP